MFLTVVTAQRRPILACRPAFDALHAIWSRSPEVDGWSVGDFLLMPHHVHLFTRGGRDAKPLAAWVRTWKSLSTRALKSAMPIDGSLWQRDYFDRFLRSADNYSEKWDYVANNPVRKDLCATPDEWSWKARLVDLTF